MKPQKIIRYLFILIVILLIVILFFTCKRQNRTGLLPTAPKAFQEIPYDRAFIGANPKYRSVNLVNNFPEARNQGKQSSCSAFVIAYYLISYYNGASIGFNYLNSNNSIDFSKVYSPAFIYNYLKNQLSYDNCESGLYFNDVFDFVENFGVCKWSEFPYSGSKLACKTVPSKATFDIASNNNDFKFFKIRSDKSAIISYLDRGIPIIISLWTSHKMSGESDLKLNSLNRYVWSPSYFDKKDLHAMLCIGYDVDTKQFALLNSWGKDWGKDGVCWISHDKFYQRAREFYIMRPVEMNTGYFNKDLAQIIDIQNPNLAQLHNYEFYLDSLTYSKVESLDEMITNNHNYLLLFDVAWLSKESKITEKQIGLLNTYKIITNDIQ